MNNREGTGFTTNQYYSSWDRPRWPYVTSPPSPVRSPTRRSSFEINWCSCQPLNTSDPVTSEPGRRARQQARQHCELTLRRRQSTSPRPWASVYLDTCILSKSHEALHPILHLRWTMTLHNGHDSWRVSALLIQSSLCATWPAVYLHAIHQVPILTLPRSSMQRLPGYFETSSLSPFNSYHEFHPGTTVRGVLSRLMRTLRDDLHTRLL